MYITSIPTRTRSPSRTCASASRSRRRRTATGAWSPTRSSIVANGDRHWFLTPRDMVEVAAARRHQGQAARGAGHHRRASAASSRATRRSSASWRATASAPSTTAATKAWGCSATCSTRTTTRPTTVDTTPQNAYEPFKGCAVVVVAPPPSARAHSVALDRRRSRRGFARYLLGGRQHAARDRRRGARGRAGVLEGARAVRRRHRRSARDRGRSARDDPDTRANTFVVTAKAHPVTAASHRRRRGEGSAARRPRHDALPAPRAAEARRPRTCSSRATSRFAVDLERATAIIRTIASEVPEKQAGDVPGPFVLAMASERAKAPRTPRTDRASWSSGSTIAFSQPNLRAPLPWHGTAFLVGNASRGSRPSPRCSTSRRSRASAPASG